MDIDYAKMGERIAQRRKALSATQEDVAEVAGLSNNHISNIENNRSIPSIEALMNICRALKTTPDYCLLGAVRNADQSRISAIDEMLKLCDGKRLVLIEHFIDWAINENIDQ